MAKANPGAREALLEAGERLMRVKGYAATTVEQICNEASVTKGAFFHYFRSKEDLTKAALERFTERGAEAFATAPFMKKKDPLERVEGFVDLTIDLFTNPAESCLVGVLAQEVSETHPVLRSVCLGALTGTTATLKTLLDEAKAVHAPRATVDTRLLAEHFVAVFEGAVILSKVKNDLEPMRSHLGQFKRTVRALLDGGAAKKSKPRRH